MSNDPGEIIIFQTEDGQTRVDVRLVSETVWLSAGQIATLFQRDKSTISRQIQDAFEERELKPEPVVALSATTAAAGKTYQLTAAAARTLADQQDEIYLRRIDAQPPPVEEHFDEAVNEAKQRALPKKNAENRTEGTK